MSNKVLVKLYVPEIEEIYELYIPINKTIGEISKIFSEMVNDLSKAYPIKNNCLLCNRYTGEIYDRHLDIFSTNIRNGTELILF